MAGEAWRGGGYGAVASSERAGRERPAQAQRGNRPCDAETLVGQPCRSFALRGSLYCLSHDPERAEQVQASRARGAKRGNRLRALRGRGSKLDTMPELVKFVADVVKDTTGRKLDVAIARTVLYGISIQRQLIEASDLADRVRAIEERLGRAMPIGRVG